MKNINNKSALAIAKAYHKSWTSKNYNVAATYLEESIEFEMPINSYENKKEFMDAVRFTGDAATNINLLTEIGDDKEAVIIYDFTFAPIGNMRIVEHFKVANGKIVFIRHIHDTYQLRKVGFDNNNS